MYNVYNIVWNLTENQFGTRTMCKHVALYLHITWYAEALLTRNLMKNVLYVKSVLNFISWVFVKICWMNFSIFFFCEFYWALPKRAFLDIYDGDRCVTSNAPMNLWNFMDIYHLKNYSSDFPHIFTRKLKNKSFRKGCISNTSRIW